MKNNKEQVRLKSYNHPLYRKNSQLLRALFNGDCIMCNKNCDKIEIHHNDRNRNNNDLYNLAHVCKDCHKLIHKSNFYFSDLKERIVKRLKILVSFIEAGKSL